MRILVEQLNGETFELEVTAEMTMTDVKEQVKWMHEWEDELSHDTTVVDLIIGDKKVTNEETVEERGLCDGSKVTVVFRNNVVQCSDKSGLSPDLDPETLVIVEIPDSEAAIKAQAFEGCRCVAKVIIPSSVSQIGECAFQHSSSLAAVNISDSVTQIGKRAFSSCTSLVTITIPNAVTLIDAQAFANCRSLTTINIPDSVMQIGAYAFTGCCWLASINIPSSVTQIGDFAFNHCNSLISVDIPDSVTDIGRFTFNNCHRLTLTAPARLLSSQIGAGCKMVAKECGCGGCDWIWFREGWVCPERLAGE